MAKDVVTVCLAVVTGVMGGGVVEGCLAECVVVVAEVVVTGRLAVVTGFMGGFVASGGVDASEGVVGGVCIVCRTFGVLQTTFTFFFTF